MALIQRQDSKLPLATQAYLLSVNRTSLYYKQRDVAEEIIYIRHRIDEIHTNFPAYGSRTIRDVLKNEGIHINRKAVQRHMQAMGIYVIYPGLNLSKRNQQHRVIPISSGI